MKITLSISLSCCLLVLPVVSQAETLTVYTYDSFASEWGPGPKIEKAFENVCDCDLKFVALDDGVSILNRLRLEGTSSKADVILGLDDSLMDTAEKTGLLMPHQVNTSGLTLPGGWTDKTFVPFDYGFFAFVYNREKLPHPPKSLRALVEQNPKLKIIYQDPRTSTPGQGLMFWVKSVYGDKAADAWKLLAAKTVTVTKGWSEAYSMFLKGESDLVLSYTTSPAYHVMAENDRRYAATRFAEGSYQQTEVGAVVKSTEHAKLAKQFLQFMISDEVQKIIPMTNWMYPVTKVSLPQAFTAYPQPNMVLHFDAKTISEHRKQWIREWQSAVAFN